MIHRGPTVAKWITILAAIYGVAVLVFIFPFFFLKLFAGVAVVLLIARVVYLLRR